MRCDRCKTELRGKDGLLLTRCRGCHKYVCEECRSQTPGDETCVDCEVQRDTEE